MGTSSFTNYELQKMWWGCRTSDTSHVSTFALDSVFRVLLNRPFEYTRVG